MERMTYRQLLKQLKMFSDIELDADVTIVFDDEGYAGTIDVVKPDSNSDYGLEDGHPFFRVINDE